MSDRNKANKFISKNFNTFISELISEHISHGCLGCQFRIYYCLLVKQKNAQNFLQLIFYLYFMMLVSN